MLLPDELPIKQWTPRQVLYFQEANNFLKSYDQKIYPILGDGNCLFRALSQLLFEKEDYHQQIRKVLIEILILNSEVFSKYCTDSSLDEHVAHMKYETIWGTDIEIQSCCCILPSTPDICVYTEK